MYFFHSTVKTDDYEIDSLYQASNGACERTAAVYELYIHAIEKEKNHLLEQLRIWRQFKPQLVEVLTNSSDSVRANRFVTFLCSLATAHTNYLLAYVNVRVACKAMEQQWAGEHNAALEEMKKFLQQQDMYVGIFVALYRHAFCKLQSELAAATLGRYVEMLSTAAKDKVTSRLDALALDFVMGIAQRIRAVNLNPRAPVVEAGRACLRRTLEQVDDEDETVVHNLLLGDCADPTGKHEVLDGHHLLCGCMAHLKNTFPELGSK